MNMPVTQREAPAHTPVRHSAPWSGESLELVQPGMEGTLTARVLNELDYGVMLVTPECVLRFANRIALRECSVTGSVRLVDGRVRALSGDCDIMLREAVKAGGAGRRRMVGLEGCGGRTTVAVVPPSFDASEDAVLLVFGRRNVCEPLSFAFFAREHGLTAAETAVLHALCEGLSPAQVAKNSKVAVTTIRTQIAAVRMKTSAASIRDVVRMLTLLPPMVPILS